MTFACEMEDEVHGAEFQGDWLGGLWQQSWQSLSGFF